MNKDTQELSSSSSEERKPAETDRPEFDVDAFWSAYPLMSGQAQLLNVPASS